MMGLVNARIHIKSRVHHDAVDKVIDDGGDAIYTSETSYREGSSPDRFSFGCMSNSLPQRNRIAAPYFAAAQHGSVDADSRVVMLGGRAQDTGIARKIALR